MLIGKHNIRPFVVTLQELPEKEQTIQAHFKSVGIQAEAFNGIHGEVSGLRTVYPYERDAPGSGWNIGVKPVATWVSFYMLWSAMNLLPEPYFWQLEWDCCFPDDWRGRVEKALQDVPQDFDLLFIGSCCAEDKPRTRIAGDVWDVKYPVCGHSTIIAKKALPVMLKTQRKIYAPLDISLALHTLPMLKTFVILPRICSQFNTELKP
jgi:hypothetical protein